MPDDPNQGAPDGANNFAALAARLDRLEGNRPAPAQATVQPGTTTPGLDHTAIATTVAAAMDHYFQQRAGAAGAGIGAAERAVLPQYTPQRPDPAKNISDRGPATAGDVRDVESFVRTRPSEMTSADFERLQLKVGREKALQMVQESVNLHMKKIRLTPDRRR